MEIQRKLNVNVDPVCVFDKSWVKQFFEEEDHISLSWLNPIRFSENKSLQRHQTCLQRNYFFSFCDNSAKRGISFRFNSVYEKLL
jgi:hypothetical protein